MKTICKIALAASAALVATISTASAQYYGPRPYPAPYARPMMGPPGGYMGPRPMMVRPMMGPPVMIPMNAGPYYPQQAYPQQAYPQQVDPGYGAPAGNEGMGVDLSGVGPYAGAATGRVLMSNPYTAPFAPWAAGRVNANAQSAGREYDPGAAAVRTFTGVSPRDIQQYGPLGGPNSEARKIVTLGGLFKF
ncbi:hypothetical protein [Bradyrhizobium sp. F1.13.3]|uniref:hypothetical protein n=1 Tax=Bradyrhizobium sp. F1.13.3 TaxID=3156351 RepID=UPI00339691FF